MNTYEALGMYPGRLSINKTSNGNNGTTPSAHEQLDTKPAIDNVICHYLDGETLKEALFIIDNIRENNMKIKWTSINVWSVLYKRKHVCNLYIYNGALSIGPISGVLATRVTGTQQNQENIMQMIGALRSSVTSMQEANYALS